MCPDLKYCARVRIWPWGDSQNHWSVNRVCGNEHAGRKANVVGKRSLSVTRTQQHATHTRTRASILIYIIIKKIFRMRNAHKKKKYPMAIVKT